MSWLVALWETFTNPVFYKLTLSAATPLIFAALGGVFSERTGVTNIALEGIMLMGAFMGVAGTFLFGSPWIGLLLAIVCGMGLALLHAWASINFCADQIVSATALILLAQGLTGFLLEPIFGQPGSTPIFPKIPEVKLTFLGTDSFLYRMIGSLSPLVYIAFLLVIVSWFLIYKTRLGLRMRAVGENPEAADTLGVNVFRIRYFGVIMSGFFAALGGAYLSIGELGQFTENMTGGKGFIALAAMILGNWKPAGAMWACLLFGVAQALNQQLQSNPTLAISSTTKPLFNLLPFVITLIVVGGFVGRTRAPAADGVPYEKKG
ncbi:MAG TPA: ABC transporter permease [Thermotogota bacterium]|nr:ABC transporter permease [Thermotogota bacterium]HRW91875.1 ABC transporter permease [Thermotogota bacterium]